MRDCYNDRACFVCAFTPARYILIRRGRLCRTRMRGNGWPKIFLRTRHLAGLACMLPCRSVACVALVLEAVACLLVAENRDKPYDANDCRGPTQRAPLAPVNLPLGRSSVRSFRLRTS